MKSISILGIYVADLAFFGKSIPVAGETVLGENYVIGPGGKGSNQAVAAAKAGEDPLKAAALAAKAQYAGSVTVGGTKVKVSTILGSLPRQYQVVLDERGL